MRNNSNVQITQDFRAEPRYNGHPMRGKMNSPKIERQHLLRKDPAEVSRRRISLVRDIVISVMGAVSALVPIMIAIQSVTGA
jgi:hypothetical protein